MDTTFERNSVWQKVKVKVYIVRCKRNGMRTVISDLINRLSIKHCEKTYHYE